MATFEGTSRGGREIRAMRYFSRVAVDNFPRKSARKVGEGPTMANHVDCAPRRRRRPGYFFGGVDCRYGQKTSAPETSGRSAGSGDARRIFTWRYFPSQATCKPFAAK